MTGMHGAAGMARMGLGDVLAGGEYVERLGWRVPAASGAVG